MAVTYKSSNKALSHLYVYDSSAGTYSSNYAGVAAHDLFPDDATIDDIIYFGATTKFSDLYFNIGTALVAGAITLTWEYWDAYAGSWQTLTVTDNTNSFQTAGANTVLFAPPIRWAIGYSGNDPKPNNISGKYWVRCRITAVTSLTEGGANQTTAIYSKEAKIVATGTYTDFMPSLYSADVAGSWGVIQRQIMFDNHGYNYCISVPIDIGDGLIASTATITSDVVELMDGAILRDVANGALNITNSVFIDHQCYGPGMGSSGKVIVTYGTVSFLTWVGHNNDFPSYGEGPIFKLNTSKVSIFAGRQQRWGGYAPGFKSVFPAVVSDCILNVVVRGSWYGGDVDNISLTSATTFPSGSGRAIQKNIKSTAGSIVGYMDGASYTHMILVNPYFPNSDVSNPAKFFTYSCANNDFYITYGFKVKVIDAVGNPISGAVIIIQNEQNTQNYGFNMTNGTDISGPFTTDANGETSEVALLRYKHYNSTRTGYWKYCDTTVDYGVSTVTISKSGYQTKTIKYTMDRKREEVEVLEKVKDLNFSKKGRFITQ